MTQMVAVTLELLRGKVANQNVLQLTKGKIKKEDVSLTEDVSDQGEVVTESKKKKSKQKKTKMCLSCLLYTSPSPRDRQKSRMPSSA